MAFKQFALDDALNIKVYKRRGSRNIRLSIASTGEVRVSIPTWAPYASGLQFARSRQAWILEQRQDVAPLTDGQLVGKAHHLRFTTDSRDKKPTSRITAGEIIVRYPAELNSDDVAVQAVAQKACIRALRQQAQQLLPQRLTTLAARHGFSYNSVAIKQLKSRWGSCDTQKHIVLNLFLMQLPWECIDYVLVHELVHTKVLHHGADFWSTMEANLPNTKALRKQIKSYQPVMNGLPTPAVA